MLNTSIREIMRPIVTVPFGASAKEAALQMTRKGGGSLIVERDGHPVGIVTERDFAERVVANALNSSSVTAG